MAAQARLSLHLSECHFVGKTRCGSNEDLGGVFFWFVLFFTEQKTIRFVCLNIKLPINISILKFMTCTNSMQTQVGHEK